MTSLILWFLSTFLSSLWDSFKKKSVDNWKISKILFLFLGNIWWIIFLFILLFYFWIDKKIFWDYLYIIFIFLILVFEMLNWFLNLYILKNTKLSEILPYQNLDKVFIVIIGFFLFAWTDKQTSITTLFITIFIVFLIIFFTIDFKKIVIPKNIWLIFLNKLLSSFTILATWFFLLKYSSATLWVMNWLINFLIFSFLIFFLRLNTKEIFSQNKKFYTARFFTVIFWWTSWLIWLFIIEKSWVIIASLLWFLAVVFNIFAMKFILKDTPTKKQIFLAFSVIFLIWIWYYFK